MSSFFSFKRPQVPSKRSKDASAGSRPQVLSDKENSLFVFGYACKIFDDKEKALHYDQGKHLIPWPGDESLKIDRYDARLYFTSESQFVSKSDYEENLSAKEAEEERLCDEERYMELSQDMTEFEIEQEEEMKRFQEVMSEDGYYSSVSFSYEVNSEQNEPQYEENATAPEDNPNTMEPAIHQPAYWNSVADNKDTTQEEAQENNEYEVFVPPSELEIPSEMEIPQTKKMHSIIEKTAVFLSKHGAQMEIVLKAKQSGNPQFDFLSFGNWLNPYYRRVLSFIKEGKFIPETEQSSVTSPTPEKSEVAHSESESDEDSDEDYDLHPLLTASLYRKPVKPPIQSLPMQPLPSSFKPTFTPEMNERIKEQNKETQHVSWQDKNDDSQHHSWNLHEAISGSGDLNYTASMPYPVSSIYDPYSVYMNMNYVTTPIGISATQTAASMLPPPPPPPGEGPPEELDITSPGDILPLPPPPPPPVLTLCPPMLIDQESGAVFPTSSGANLIAENASPAVPPVIVPPPPDLQPIVDKLAMYVARNGEDFESTVKAKNDARFDFLNPWNAHYSYYHYKKQLCLQQVKKKKKSSDESDPSSESPKGPISFSLKTKDMKKPKIEYRTNVVYKQSVGESDEEEEEDGGDEGEENATNQEETRNKVADNDVGDQTSEKELTEEERNIQEQQNLENQMNSIAAAQREAKRLEMESLRSGKTDGDDEVALLRNEADQERQIQLERRRRASLFISMLKNTTGNGVQEAVTSADEKRLQDATTTAKVRTFSEIKRKNDTRIDQTETKKVRSSSPIFDLDESSPSGVGAPPPDSIKLTQDLMVKVFAARNKR